MLEIERKILGIDVGAVEARIKKLHPKPRKVFSGLVRVRYFDFSDGRVRKKKDLVRVREIVPDRATTYTELVYKTYRGIKKDAKYFDECEAKISAEGAFEIMSKFLRALGLQAVVYYEKRRTLYRWGKISFEVDEHPKIPPFLEIEAPSPAAIDRATAALELQRHEQTSETISELLSRKYPKIKLNGLRF